MAPRLALDYGRRPYPVELPAESRILRAPTPLEAPPSLEFLMESALDEPVGAVRLEERVRAGMRVVLVVSDSTRAEPRDALVRAVLARMPGAVSVEVAVATGTHGPCRLEDLGIGEDLASRIDRVVMHDGADRGSLVAVGTTRRGTPVTVNRAVLDADLVVATGCIIPHYFAGYGAGVKAIFPGLGGAREIRINHELKAEPGARAGVVDGNPCRDDLEEVLDFLPAPPFLLNAVVDDDGHARAAVAGDVRAAFRAGAARCAPLYTVRAPRARTVVVSGRGPITASLYQASKLVAAAAPLAVAERSSWSPSAGREPGRSRSSTAASSRSESDRDCRPVAASSWCRRSHRTSWRRPVSSTRPRSRLCSRAATRPRSCCRAPARSCARRSNERAQRAPRADSDRQRPRSDRGP